jgi:predicted flap endonuclease-1-like 5' DNA nuclease
MMELLGIAVGVGLVLLAPKIPVVRDVAKLAVKGGLAVTDMTKEVVTAAGKHRSDSGAQAERVEDVEVPIETAPAHAPTPAAAVQEATPPEPKADVTAPEPAAGKDDLTQIKGIGPKIAEMLNEAGIHTFAQLADTDVAQLQAIMDAAGPRYSRLADPAAWVSEAKQRMAGD